MFPLNGLQPQGSPAYNKASAPMNPRSRNLKCVLYSLFELICFLSFLKNCFDSFCSPMRGVGPRRTMSSGSDTQVVGGGATGNSNGLHHQQQHLQQSSYNSQPPPPRKSSNAPAPAPLLGMAPQNMVSHPPPPPHNHSNHHHTSSAPQQHSLQQTQSNQPSNGRHYNNSYSQSLPHNVSDNYHYTRPYRGGGDSRSEPNI